MSDDAALFQADRLEAVAKGMRDVAGCSAYAEGKEAARREAEQALEAARVDAALAWRRVTELQERCTQMLLEHRQQLDAMRVARDVANHAMGGYAESANYAERRLRTLVRRLGDIGIAAEKSPPDLMDVLATIEQLSSEFYDHDWEGPDELEPAP